MRSASRLVGSPCTGKLSGSPQPQTVHLAACLAARSLRFGTAGGRPLLAHCIAFSSWCTLSRESLGGQRTASRFSRTWVLICSRCRSSSRMRCRAAALRALFSSFFSRKAFRLSLARWCAASSSCFQRLHAERTAGYFSHMCRWAAGLGLSFPRLPRPSACLPEGGPARPPAARPFTHAEYVALASIKHFGIRAQVLQSSRCSG